MWPAHFIHQQTPSIAPILQKTPAIFLSNPWIASLMSSGSITGIVLCVDNDTACVAAIHRIPKQPEDDEAPFPVFSAFRFLKYLAPYSFIVPPIASASATAALESGGRR